MIYRLKQLITYIPFLSALRKYVHRIKYPNNKHTFSCGNNRSGCIHRRVLGIDNTIIIKDNCKFDNTRIKIVGNNNSITFGKNCRIGPDCSFWIEGNNCSIVIGDSNTFTMKVHFCVQEDKMSITTGNDCMFANTIEVRTSDAHPIYDKTHNIRLNPPSPVVIGDHVWVSPNSLILKGTKISNGAIIGSKSVVTHDISENSLAVGTPAKVVKDNVYWTREHLF